MIQLGLVTGQTAPSLNLETQIAGIITSEQMQQMKSGLSGRRFSQDISEDQCKQIYKLIKNKSPEEVECIPETVRAYVTLRYCADKKLEAAETISKMSKANIADEKLRYKFAVYAAKKQVSDFTNEMSDFKITDVALIRRLAEVALYFDAEAFFSDLNEFDFDTNPIREKYFLRGLVRSTGAIQKLLEDDFFISSLKDLQTELLKFIYEHFGFGKEIIKACIQKVKNIIYIPRNDDSSKEFTHILSLMMVKDLIPDDEVSVFALFVRNPASYCWISNDIYENTSFLEALNEQEQIQLLAMLLLLKSLANPQVIIRYPEVLEFLKEIHSFRSPLTRFAIVALALKEVEEGSSLIDQLTFSTDTTKSYSRMYSVVLCICRRLCPGVDMSFLKSKWNDNAYVKEFIIFLAELCFSEKLTNDDRKNILSRLFTDKRLQSKEILIDFTSCLSNRLTKQLTRGQNPHQVLAERAISFINRMGKNYKCAIDSSLFFKLRHTEEIVQYVQSLEKLPENEKDQMVPFFFRFLNFLAEGKMSEMRFTRELSELFTSYKLERNIWEHDCVSKVGDILARFPGHVVVPDDVFNVEDALMGVFEEKHLEASEYQDFYKFAKRETATAPILDGKIYGEYRDGTIEEKNKAVMHLLAKLFIQTVPAEQRRYLVQLKKMFSQNHDFYKDIANWIKEIDSQQMSKVDEAHDEYEVVRSSDPYKLFLIGSFGKENCQRVNGDPAKNKCLLSFCCDGKNEIVYTRDGEGEIQSFAILRFFYAVDNQNINKKFPILYLEPVYAKAANPKLATAITLSAIECAKQLGVPLVRHFKVREGEGQAGYPYTLTTINGPAPFEYFDGLEAKIKSNNRGFDGNSYRSTHQDAIKGSYIKLLFDPSTGYVGY